MAQSKKGCGGAQEMGRGPAKGEEAPVSALSLPGVDTEDLWRPGVTGDDGRLQDNLEILITRANRIG